MGLFTKRIQYNRLAMAINGMVLIINELDERAMSGGKEDVYAQIEQELFIAAYMYRINIIDRLEKYNWDETTPIIVPNISSKRTTLEFAFNNTIDKLNSLADDLSCLDEVTSILKKSDYFFKIENSLPIQLKIKLNQGL